jgi:hypothetical protein
VAFATIHPDGAPAFTVDNKAFVTPSFLVDHIRTYLNCGITHELCCDDRNIAVPGALCHYTAADNFLGNPAMAHSSCFLANPPWGHPGPHPSLGDTAEWIKGIATLLETSPPDKRVTVGALLLPSFTTTVDPIVAFSLDQWPGIYHLQKFITHILLLENVSFGCFNPASNSVVPLPPNPRPIVVYLLDSSSSFAAPRGELLCPTPPPNTPTLAPDPTESANIVVRLHAAHREEEAVDSVARL